MIADVLALKDAVLPQARLIAFSSPVIVPFHVLTALGFGACNFIPVCRIIRAGRRRISRSMTAQPPSAPPRM